MKTPEEMNGPEDRNAQERPSYAADSGHGLDPLDHPDRWEQLVARINQAAADTLAARRPASVGEILASWRRPVVVGSLGLVAAGALAVMVLPDSTGTEATEVTIAEAVLPWAVAGWIDERYEPSVMEVVTAMEGS